MYSHEFELAKEEGRRRKEEGGRRKEGGRKERLVHR